MRFDQKKKKHMRFGFVKKKETKKIVKEDENYRK